MKEVLWRNEKFRGSGVRDAQQVLMFEIFELYNSDILATVKKQMESKSDTAYKYFSSLEDMVREFSGRDFYNEAFTCNQTETILELINENFNKNIKYALWLTSYYNAVDKELYGENLEVGDIVYGYVVGDVLLSDLGNGDQLWGYENMPESHIQITIEEKIEF